MNLLVYGLYWVAGVGCGWYFCLAMIRLGIRQRGIGPFLRQCMDATEENVNYADGAEHRLQAFEDIGEVYCFWCGWRHEDCKCCTESSRELDEASSTEETKAVS